MGWDGVELGLGVASQGMKTLVESAKIEGETGGTLTNLGAAGGEKNMAKASINN